MCVDIRMRRAARADESGSARHAGGVVLRSRPRLLSGGRHRVLHPPCRDAWTRPSSMKAVTSSDAQRTKSSSAAAGCDARAAMRRPRPNAPAHRRARHPQRLCQPAPRAPRTGAQGDGGRRIDVARSGFRAVQLTAALSGAPFYRRLGFSEGGRKELRLPDGAIFECVPMRKSLAEAADLIAA